MNNPLPYLSVVIPAYNEEKRLPHTLRATIGYLKKQPYTWEIAVVNDGSSDKTADIVRSMGIEDPRVRLLHYGGNKGKGYAVRYGMTHVQGEIRIFMDADNSTGIEHAEKFIPLVAQGFDVVIGSRDVAGAEISVHQPKWKELLGDLGNIWIQFWAVPGIKDTQAGFKLFTKKASDAVFPYLTIDRWGFDVEALAVARMKGYKISEQPVRWINDPNSKVSGSAYLEVLKEVVQVRLNMTKGIYNG
ncbi:MAG TPA: dolichyl-phosphate beta-glucosyltransferase [Candidatus Andersenbacteria bacterium]|nr:dolichyl-phosphate beta-glucosyltransferase [Candidatus Andersenbacteria bacterium]